jgi:hypothetical protein
MVKRISWFADDAVAYNAVKLGQMIHAFSKKKEVEIVSHFCWPLVTE